MLLRKILFSLILILISNHSFSQNYNDTIELILIKPVISNNGYIPPYWPPETPNPWSAQWGTNWTGNYIISNTKSLCGENFHENGSLARRCECDSDSTLHGKSVY
jgi:hypothetical protein